MLEYFCHRKRICYNRDLRSRANFTLRKLNNSSIETHERKKHEKWGEKVRRWLRTILSVIVIERRTTRLARIEILTVKQNWFAQNRFLYSQSAKYYKSVILYRERRCYFWNTKKSNRVNYSTSFIYISSFRSLSIFSLFFFFFFFLIVKKDQ